MSNPFKWGIIGCGNVSGDFARALENTKNPVVLKGVAASTKERAQEFCVKHELSSEIVPYGSYEELLQDSEIEVVYVGALNHLHKECVLKALDSGKHVLCEKPLGLNTSEVKEMVQKAREKSLFLMEGYWTRFFPVYQTIWSEIKDIGEVKVFMSDFGFSHHTPNKMELSKGGGNLMATGCYTVMLACWFFGVENFERVHVTGKVVESGIDIWANITLEFKDNKQAILFYTGEANTPCQATIIGSNGFFQVPDHLWCPTKLIRQTGQPRTPELRREARNFPVLDASTEYRYPNSWGFAYEADHVYECIRGGKTESPIMSHDESIKIAEILEEIRRQLGVKYPQDS